MPQKKMNLRVNGLDIGANDLTIDDTWTILINGTPVKGSGDTGIEEAPNATTKSVLVPNILPTYIAWVDNSKSYVYTGDANNEYYPVNIPSPINLTYQIGCWVSPKTQSLNIVTGINRSTQTARVVINYTK